MVDLPTNRIQYFNKRLTSMETERKSFDSHYKEITNFLSPRRGRFFTQDRNKGDKRYQAIINSRGTQALRTATAGMLNGTMSPSRPWFSLQPTDFTLLDSEAVRAWLFTVENIIRTILNDSNFYNMVPVLLKELMAFGTGCMTHISDFNDVARFYAHTVGSYFLAQNDRLVIDTLARQFEWPVIQIVRQFGLSNVSQTVKTAYDKGNYDQWHKVCHFIEPNDNFQASGKLSTNKAFISVYFQPDNNGVDSEKVLSIGGFDEFPAYTPRWDVTEGDIYGVDCPGMVALGDVKQLQAEEKRKAQGIDKMVNPPLTGPANLKNIPVSGVPGGLTLYDGDDQKQRLAPVYQVDPRLQELRADMDAVERRIEQAFFVDLFFAISNMEGIQPRNQLDLAQRNEERLVQLGPVLERLHGELLSKLVNRVFDQAVAADILPEAPEELQDQNLNVRFISTLAMAQKAVVVADIERLFQFGSGLVNGGWQTSALKLDANEALDEYSRALGVPPKVVRSDEDVQADLEAQQEQQQLAQLAELANTGAQAAKTASEVNIPDEAEEVVDEQ